MIRKQKYEIHGAGHQSKESVIIQLEKITSEQKGNKWEQIRKVNSG